MYTRIILFEPCTRVRRKITEARGTFFYLSHSLKKSISSVKISTANSARLEWVSEPFYFDFFLFLLKHSFFPMLLLETGFQLEKRGNIYVKGNIHIHVEYLSWLRQESILASQPGKTRLWQGEENGDGEGVHIYFFLYKVHCHIKTCVVWVCVWASETRIYFCALREKQTAK